MDTLTPAVAGFADARTPALPPLRMQYADGPAEEVLNRRDVLALIGFGASAPVHADPRYTQVALAPAAQPAPFELWCSARQVEHGRAGALRWSSDGDYAFVALEFAERDFGDIARTTQAAYARLEAWRKASATPHWLRIWNYVDAINAGTGDDERYRQFCAGRAAGMDAAPDATYPAASAIGVRDGRRVLQVCALVARVPGTTVENPRQVSAWRYPREYGPVAPTFARALRAPALSPQLYISGTAAVVGHASHHVGDVAAQIDETLANLDSLRRAAGCAMPLGGPHSALRAYVRHAPDAALVRERVRVHLGADTPVLVLLGDICRAELLVEIDGMHDG
jgi:chorismate lyase/3-hydroxybenzoate synthase